MTKWVEVPVTIYKTFAVEFEDDETVADAVKCALDECFGDNADVGDCMVAENDQVAEQIQRLSDERIAI